MKFKPKIDWWLSGLLFLIALMAVELIISSVILKQINQLFSGIVLMAVVILFIIPMYVLTYYEITEDSLIIKSGYTFKKEITIASIEGVMPTHNPLNSKVMSTNRIAVYHKHKHKTVTEFISPKNRDLFLSELLKRNPDIIVRK